jgi:general secretion pathway protein J
METLNHGLERIVADLTAAEFVTANAKAKHILFDGSELAVSLVRPAIGPNTRPGLEFVRIGMISDDEGPALVRTRAPFTILPLGMEIGDVANLGDPVVLLRSPYRTVFSYAGPDNVWRSTWHEAERLPLAIRVSVYNAATETVLAISTATLVHVNASAECAAAQNARECVYGKPKAKQNAL